MSKSSKEKFHKYLFCLLTGRQKSNIADEKKRLTNSLVNGANPFIIVFLGFPNFPKGLSCCGDPRLCVAYLC